LTYNVYPEDESNRFLWNNGNGPDYTVSHFTYY
jgi:hypothetical protein